MRKKEIIVMLTSLLLAGCSNYKVYSVKERPAFRQDGGVVYALPITQLRVAVTIERRNMSGAPYCDYASDFLGLGPETQDTSFHIASIELSTQNVADPDNCFFVKVRNGSLSVNEQHLLTAVGMTTENSQRTDEIQPETQSTPPAVSQQPLAKNNIYEHHDTLYSRHDQPGHPTLITTRKDIRNRKQRAAAAAERLGELQEREQQLLNGEHEGSYDLNTIRYLREQLHLQQEEIIAAFCGNMESETIYLYYSPNPRKREAMIDTLAYFSPTVGMLSAGLETYPSDAKPIVCDIQAHDALRSATRFVKYHTKGSHPNRRYGSKQKSHAFRYRIPEQVTATIMVDNYSVSRQVLMSQLGPIVKLPTRSTKALFDPNSLDLIYLNR